MDSLLSSRFLKTLPLGNTTSKQQLISYLSLLHARNYAHGTLQALLVAIKRFLVNLPEPRKLVVADNFAHTTASDVDAFIDSAKSKGLASSTINVTLSALKKFFDFLRDAGQMQLQPIIRRRHRLFTLTTLPKAMPEADLIELFKVIDSIRDRLIFLLRLRCDVRCSRGSGTVFASGRGLFCFASTLVTFEPDDVTGRGTHIQEIRWRNLESQRLTALYRQASI
jgi:site-specific recombinase XerC